MPLVRRVEILEGDVNALRQLPVQVSALGADVATLRADLATLTGDVATLTDDVATLAGDVATLAGDLAALREEVRSGDEETRRQMRVLHEEVISRIALLDEGRKTRRRRTR